MSEHSALLDRALFDEFADLFDPDEMRDVIAEWYADVTAALVIIDEALERGNPAEVARVAHRTAAAASRSGRRASPPSARGCAPAPSRARR